MRSSAGEKLIGGLRARHVQKVRMHEAEELAGFALDGDADVDDVVDGAEEVVEFAVGHVEGEVTDVERAGGRLVGAPQGSVGLGELDDDAPAFEDLRVHGLDGAGGGFDGVHGYVTKPGNTRVQGVFFFFFFFFFSSGRRGVREFLEQTHPLLRPRES